LPSRIRLREYIPLRNRIVVRHLELLTMSQYFWLICGAWCGILGAFYTRFRLRKHITSGDFTDAEVKSFTRGYALWIFLPCVAFWLLQQSIGSNAPPAYFKWSGPQKVVAISLQVFLWAALLYWVFLREGADTLSRFLQAEKSSSNWLYHPVAFKVGAIAAVLGGLAALLGGSA
jgi:hypothetical protein